MTSNRPTLLKGCFAPPPVEQPPSPLEAIGVINSQPIRLATLVAPNVIVCASHYQKENPLPEYPTITFTRANGEVVTKKILSGSTWLDIAAFGIDSDPGIAPLEVANIDEIRDPKAQFYAVGIQNVMTDPKPIVAPATFQQLIGATAAKFQQTNASTIENGDSGAPVVVYVRNRYKIVGTNYANRGKSFWLVALLAPFLKQISALS
jgi:hypothetical protein